MAPIPPPQVDDLRHPAVGVWRPPTSSVPFFQGVIHHSPPEQVGVTLTARWLDTIAALCVCLAGLLLLSALLLALDAPPLAAQQIRYEYDALGRLTLPSSPENGALRTPGPWVDAFP